MLIILNVRICKKINGNSKPLTNQHINVINSDTDDMLYKYILGGAGCVTPWGMMGCVVPAREHGVCWPGG